MEESEISEIISNFSNEIKALLENNSQELSQYLTQQQKLFATVLADQFKRFTNDFLTSQQQLLETFLRKQEDNLKNQLLSFESGEGTKNEETESHESEKSAKKRKRDAISGSDEVLLAQDDSPQELNKKWEEFRTGHPKMITQIRVGQNIAVYCEEGPDYFWLGRLLMTSKKNLRVQWYNKQEDNTYELVNQIDVIPQQSLLVINLHLENNALRKKDYEKIMERVKLLRVK